jgi:hypothetical protein
MGNKVKGERKVLSESAPLKTFDLYLFGSGRESCPTQARSQSELINGIPIQ